MPAADSDHTHSKDPTESARSTAGSEPVVGETSR
jgi:hypothetical protein